MASVGQNTRQRGPSRSCMKYVAETEIKHGRRNKYYLNETGEKNVEGRANIFLRVNRKGNT